MPRVGRRARLRAALALAGVPTATVDEMLAAARGESVRPTSVTASVAEQWAWRVAEREATLEQFAAHVWHLTGTPTPVRPHHGTT